MTRKTLVVRRILRSLTFAAALACGLAGAVEAVPPPDPATSTTYPCHFIQDFTWNLGGDGVGAVTGKIRWPSATCSSADGPPAGRPVLVFAHGVGMTYTDHDYLMAHLARNGFVTASIDDSGDNEERGAQMISYLNSLHTFWSWRTRLSNRVAFAGHSRGGEAAVTAARLLGDSPSLGVEAYDVRAVISIAPTDGGGSSGSDPREVLTGNAARGYLALYGSHDSDVTGSMALQGTNLEPQKTAFAIYDRAGSEASNEGLVIAGTHLDKAFVFIYGMAHRDFLDDDGPALGTGTVDGENVAKAYFNAFLQWKVFDQADYRVFFDGSTRPDSLADLELFQQLSAGPRRTVDNFEDGDPAVDALGGGVAKSSSGILTFLEGPLDQLVKSSPHATGGLRVTWVAPSWVRWSLPNAAPLFVGPLRDVSGYAYLSFRVAQVYHNTYNTEGEDQDFNVQLSTSLGLSDKVRVSLHGRIPYPDEFQCSGSLNCGLNPPNDFSKSAMSTVRVPLPAFTNADLTDVRYVYLTFDVPERPTGAITLDSLELVQ
jgi:hypothetical protein